MSACPAASEPSSFSPAASSFSADVSGAAAWAVVAAVSAGLAAPPPHAVMDITIAHDNSTDIAFFIYLFLLIR